MSTHRPWLALVAGFVLSACNAGASGAPPPPLDSAPARGSDPVRRALLVGIDDYESQLPPGDAAAPPGRGFRNLHGAAGDARALREVLVERFGFARENVHVLTDGAATREAILSAFEHQLVNRAGPGDTVVFYFGGHGSQVKNSESDELDRLDESLVPADAGRNALDIRDKELRKLLNQVLDRGAVPTVVLDSCHSGSGTRGFPTGVGPRALGPDLRDVKDPGPHGPDPAERGALILSAARADELAWETLDEDGEPHGAFSWALLQALRDAVPEEPAEETFQRVRARLHSELRRQEPVLEGSDSALRTPLFGTGSDRVPRQPVVAVERIEENGSVILQGGWAQGLSEGSLLTWRPEPNGPARELEVVKMLGLSRARAERIVVLEPGEMGPPAPWPPPPPGTLLEITGWAAPLGRILRVALPTGDPTTARNLAAEIARRTSARGVQWVTEPTSESPTHVLRPHDDGWELVGLAGAPIRFARRPSADEVLRRVPPKSRLFVQTPVPSDLAQTFEIGPGTDNNGIESTPHLANAAAVLVGRFRDERIEYAWLRPDSATTDSAQGLPAATPWRSGDEAGSELLRDDLFHLRKIHGWMSLESPPRADFGYRLALVSPRSRAARSAGGTLRRGEEFELVLEARPNRNTSELKARFVYVFSIDSAGASVLLYGLKSDDNPQPFGFRPGRLPPTVSLGREPLVRVTPPFGRDHYVLLTSDEPLPNPWVLEYRGFRPRGPAGTTGLEELLSITGGTTRASERPVTTIDWSIERWSFVSEG